MKKSITLFTLIGFCQFLFAQSPISTPDNLGAGNGLKFANTNYINVGNVASLDVNTITISAWVRYNGPASNWDFIISNNFPDTDASGYALTVVKNDASSIQFETADGSSIMHILKATGVLPFDEWCNVVATYDGSTKRIYINGELKASTGWGGPISYPDNTTFRIGSSYNVSSDRSFIGYMDEFQVWNRALSQSEIKNNMCISLEGNESGLIGYWNMNEGTGGTVTDLTSNGNNGTLQ